MKYLFLISFVTRGYACLNCYSQNYSENTKKLESKCKSNKEACPIFYQAVATEGTSKFLQEVQANTNTGIKICKKKSAEKDCTSQWSTYFHSLKSCLDSINSFSISDENTLNIYKEQAIACQQKNQPPSIF